MNTRVTFLFTVLAVASAHVIQKTALINTGDSLVTRKMDGKNFAFRIDIATKDARTTHEEVGSVVPVVTKAVTVPIITKAVAIPVVTKAVSVPVITKVVATKAIPVVAVAPVISAGYGNGYHGAARINGGLGIGDGIVREGYGRLDGGYKDRCGGLGGGCDGHDRRYGRLDGGYDGCDGPNGGCGGHDGGCDGLNGGCGGNNGGYSVLDGGYGGLDRGYGGLDGGYGELDGGYGRLDGGYGGLDGGYGGLDGGYGRLGQYSKIGDAILRMGDRLIGNLRKMDGINSGNGGFESAGISLRDRLIGGGVDNLVKISEH